MIILFENYRNMFRVFYRPTETIEKNKKANASDGLKNILLALIPLLILQIIGTALQFSLASLLSLVIAVIIIPLYITTLFGAIATVYWGASKLLGNKATIDSFMGLEGLIVAGGLMVFYIVAVIAAILSLLSSSISGIIAGAGMVAIIIWSLFVNYKMLTTGMKMTKIRAAAMTLLILIAMLVIVVVMLYALSSTLMASAL